MKRSFVFYVFTMKRGYLIALLVGFFLILFAVVLNAFATLVTLAGVGTILIMINMILHEQKKKDEKPIGVASTSFRRQDDE